MSSDADLIKLYSKRILALAADIPLVDPIDAPDVTIKRRAPLCGSTVTVSINVEDGRITDYSQNVKACALGQASAALDGRACDWTGPARNRGRARCIARLSGGRRVGANGALGGI